VGDVLQDLYGLLLSKYSPGCEQGARLEIFKARRFPVLQPFGAYPIHIIVKNGRITLVGVVDSNMDKQIAETRAREVTGVFEVNDHLTVNAK
jgi:hypothetical protein